MSTQQKGQEAEQKALDYLLKKGLKLILRNYSCRCGEIDLIMRDGAYLVFIEVRARSSNNFGGSLESITYAKRQKIIKTTAYYLLKYKIQDQYPIRFDVLAIEGPKGTITWLKDAFNAND